ncbi:hypothetical protein GCM10011507_17440 [Edaphobacter acidisoli]|uniref:Periplasmic heavy metal sensor n=1 Tax=Edaphobacter acidisoli TaxID=2040573 RepID=A0A916RTE4_9BACT|nr:hypothetical protein [Edaphobacter acidisoli]GGA66436.1 hypothetical protein GCM10011507_17440 [Edaphobacter acidisoli]
MHGPTHPTKLIATAATILLLVTTLNVTATAEGNGGVQQQNPIYLPDPVPRPPDLQKIYEQNPQQKAREQEIARIKNAQRRMQIAEDTDKIAALAEQLRQSLKESAADNNPAMNAQKVAEIQKLAKAIKNLEKLQ